MQVSSAGGLYYGQLGLQRSQNSLDQASSKVAAASSQSLDVDSTVNVSKVDTDIREGLVSAHTSELAAQANAKVIGAADNALGTLIDLNV